MRFLLCLIVVIGTLVPAQLARADDTISTAAEMASALKRGINFGNTFEAPYEGAWEVLMTDDMFPASRQAGFSTIRLPVRFNDHAGLEPPYALNEMFMMRIDRAVSLALAQNMNIVLDFHHSHQLDGEPLDYGESDPDPPLTDEQNRARFVGIWAQVASRYANQPNDSVLFELYDEPHNKLTADVWNALLPLALAGIRKTNPKRYVIVGPNQYNSAYALDDLQLPPDDRLIVTFHNYEPFEFTHQGAEWIDDSAGWLGTTCCSAAQKAQLDEPLDLALSWAKEHHRPLWVGEFGSQYHAPHQDRVTYSRLAREEMEERGISWAYWNLATDNFGIYSATTGRWDETILTALVPKPG